MSSKNYGRNSTKKRLNSSTSKTKKDVNKFIFTFVKTLFLCLLVAVILAGAAGVGMIKGIIDNAPDVDVESIVPLGFATTVYDSAGNVTDTLVMAGSNREEATYEELPKDLINAFVAIEDSRFWRHKGIDAKAIMRAVTGVITGKSSKGGGSTITQQLIKNNVFNGGRESSFGAKLERKFQEMYLAVQLEKKLDKETIITNYLNTINLGSNALGVKVAARRYFGKEVSELNLSECAVIAAITKGPTKYNPITGQEANAGRRRIILQYMFDQKYISKQQQEEALADDVYSRIQTVNTANQGNTNTYSYFTDALIDQLTDSFVNTLGYSETQAHNMIYSGGLSIYTTQDPALQAIVDQEVNDPANYSSTKYSVQYRLTIKEKDGTTKNYSEKNLNVYHKDTLRDAFDGLYPSEEAAKADVDAYKAALLREGDEILGENFKTVLEPQVSFVLMDQKTGAVKAINGGRGPKTTSLSLNRASQSTRQPGSTFKVISAFAPAIDSCGDTLGSTYYDAEYTIGTKTFQNWYSKQGYLGWSSIRDGIIYSMNIVALKTLMDTVTPQVGVEYAKNFGITTLTDTDYGASLALGGLTKGVTNLELTGAFATIANGGVYTKPVFFSKVIDHNGKTIIDNTVPESHRVIKDSTAFLLTDAMAASMNTNRKFARSGVSVNSTSTRAHLDNMSAAGKSGTTTNNVDIWFVGFTPYYTAGVWAGCDDNQSLSDNGGSSFHKDIWRKIMSRVSEGQSDPGFVKPSSIESAQICRKSGKLAIPGVCNHDPRGDATYTEYFDKNNVPTELCDHHTAVTVCSQSGQLPTSRCPSTTTKITLNTGGPGTTDDSYFATPTTKCHIHSGEPASSETESEEEEPPAVTGPNGGPGVNPGFSTEGPGYQGTAPQTVAPGARAPQTPPTTKAPPAQPTTAPTTKVPQNHPTTAPTTKAPQNHPTAPTTKAPPAQPTTAPTTQVPTTAVPTQPTTKSPGPTLPEPTNGPGITTPPTQAPEASTANPGPGGGGPVAHTQGPGAP